MSLHDLFESNLAAACRQLGLDEHTESEFEYRYPVGDDPLCCEIWRNNERLATVRADYSAGTVGIKFDSGN